MIGETKKGTKSAYQPSQEVMDLTKVVKKDYDTGVTIIQKAYTELNGRTVIEDENNGQRMFNAFVDTSCEDPSEKWKWRGTRSMARNKAISMHANLTANYLLPLFIAQNEDDDVDKDFSEVMQDIVEWMAQPTNSKYQESFIQMVFAMETNPVTFLGAEYCEVMQEIKAQTDSGIEKQEVLDTVLSGFQAPIYSASQVLITNAYERNMQKQRAIIERRYVDYEELKAKYSEHPNWWAVTKGIKSIYSEEDGLFYDIKDDDAYNDLVAEEIYKNRREDLEVPFINGIYMGDDNTEHNPIKHRDNRDRPKYNKIPFGYHRIGEHFFYFKSMMNALQWDDMLIDAMYEVGMNNELLQSQMPVAISGVDNVDSDVIFPNAVVALSDPNAKVMELAPKTNAAASAAARAEVERSMDQGSAMPPTLEGQLPAASTKATTVLQAQANAKKLISAVGKSLAPSMIMYGDLMKDIAINHITIPQVEELTGGKLKLRYSSFLLENKSAGGRTNDRVIKFDEELIGAELTETEKRDKSMELLEESDYDHKTKKSKKPSIRRVNPELFAKANYLTKIDIEAMFNKSQEFLQPLLRALRQELANDPFIDMQELDRKVVYATLGSDGDDLIKEQPEQEQPVAPGLPSPTAPKAVPSGLKSELIT